ncbi:CDP-alcohol phosphatidyltransferase family protein [Actinorugispora endophytica]|uniref:CDP-alcohol phosphatidyltransferase-like enzyme n=1 Tax=Actinorugispora endophytica TaxID=1605990 RepID=A0A4R6ULR9_9ACTN|nr:CDP-alcohol phosphatidyltransferase family protein [Actinorugispora endophytica]TDQ47998.1 CDP-alcohol phosphatidyltransferase-like enzyme [Actinorugispora endophytica]
MTPFTFADVREQTYKPRDAWWTVFLVDPLAGRLVVVTANRTSITPNQLTLGAGVLGLASAACFAMATWPWLVAGALLFHLSFVLDCMDGKIARLKGTGSVFGVWADFVFDRIRFFGCMLALLIGQWAHTGEVVYLLLAPVATFVDMLRYLNGPEVAKVRRTMRWQLKAAALGHRVEAEHGDAESTDHDDAGSVDPGEETEEGARGVEAPRKEAVADVNAGFGARFRGYERVRASLLRSRVRPHLFSGIEFEMFVCVVAPLTAVVSLFTPWDNLVVPVVVFSVFALLLFEAVLVYKLWLATRSFAREMARLADG